jgi:hypothetical protein
MGLILKNLKRKVCMIGVWFYVQWRAQNRENKPKGNLVVASGRFPTDGEMTLLLPPVDRLQVHFRLAVTLLP